jgi:hypothetical protein
MIDISEATPLVKAARLVPAARNGKQCHASTHLRWVLRGATAPDGQRVHLEAIRAPRGWLTTKDAIQAFLPCRHLHRAPPCRAPASMKVFRQLTVYPTFFQVASA